MKYQTQFARAAARKREGYSPRHLKICGRTMSVGQSWRPRATCGLVQSANPRSRVTHLNCQAVMISAYHFASTALFLTVPPFLLALRFAKPSRMPWWPLVLLTALLCWLFSSLAVYFHYEHLSEVVAAAGGVEGAPKDLVSRWQSDGAKRVFAYWSGWLYGLIYLLPWLVIYSLAAAARNAVARRRSAAT